MSASTPERQSARLNPGKKPHGPDSASKNNNQKGKKNNTSELHNYTGNIMSYEDQESQRPGYGTVGKWRKNDAVYEVDFTFSDMQDPYEQVDNCTLAFVEAHLVEEGMGRAWLEAVKKQLAIDTPRTAKKRRQKRHNKVLKDTHTPVPASTTQLQGSGQTNPKKRSVDDYEDSQENEHDESPKHKSPKSYNKIDESSLTNQKKRKKHSVDDSEDSQANEDDESPKHKSPKSNNKIDESSLDQGVKALLSHAVREGIYNIRPNPDKRIKPFMYWNPEKKTACIKMLLKRAPGILALADKMRRNEFARLWSKTVRTLANNERSSQIRQLKLIYLATSDFSMVSNYDIGTSNSHIMTEENFQAVKISSALSSEFTNITDLRNALFSPRMYEYPKLFDLFCAGLESGRVRGTKHMSISPIEQLITVAHEAHFRLELWYALSLTRFRHTIIRSYKAERFAKHTEFCKFVAQDRRENGTAAFKHRNAAVLNVLDDNDDSSSDSDDGVNGEYY
jgi:hypothetical protein